MRVDFDIDGVEVASTNEMYMPRPKRVGRRLTAYVTKTKALRDFEAMVDPMIARSLTDSVVTYLRRELADDGTAIRLTITYSLTSRAFFTSDVSNYVKTLEDRIKERLGVDDARNCEVHLDKVLSDRVTTHVRLETYRLPYEVPKGKWPKKVKKGR